MEFRRVLFRSTAPEAAALVPDIAAVVGDEPRAAIHQAQREVGLALARLAENQHAAMARRDTAGMDVDDFQGGPARKHPAGLAIHVPRRTADGPLVAPALAGAALILALGPPPPRGGCWAQWPPARRPPASHPRPVRPTGQAP